MHVEQRTVCPTERWAGRGALLLCSLVPHGHPRGRRALLGPDCLKARRAVRVWVPCAFAREYKGRFLAAVGLAFF